MNKQHIVYVQIQEPAALGGTFREPGYIGDLSHMGPELDRLMREGSVGEVNVEPPAMLTFEPNEDAPGWQEVNDASRTG